MIGKTIDGKYRVVREIGAGGMGAVYEANHVGTGRRVALKVITSDLSGTPEALARFQREARASGALESQHIVQIFDTGIDRAEGVPFLVMEYLEGEDLEKVMRRLGPLSPDLALRIVAQACVGLSRAHEAGVVHRDIKPANLFLAERESRELVVRILDFGIAKIRQDPLGVVRDSALTQSGSMIGSPTYMSPEQATGLKNIDLRTDIWSLGAVLYQLLSGRTPHQHAETLGKLILSICSAPPPPLQEFAPWVPSSVAEIVHRAMRLDPNDRYPSASAMLDAARACLPNGATLDKTMVVAMPPSLRAHAAARYLPPTESTAAAPALVAAKLELELASWNAAASRTRTAAPFTKSDAFEPERRRSFGFVTALGAVVAVAAGAWLLATRAGPSGTSSSAAVPVAPSAPPAAPAARDPDPNLRTVRVVISPASATVEVDGVSTSVGTDGAVEFSGRLGSVHQLRIAANGAVGGGAVVISEAGGVPDHFEMAPAVTPAAPPGPAPRAAQVVPHDHKRPTVAPVAPPSAAKTSPPSAMTVDKTFE